MPAAAETDWIGFEENFNKNKDQIAKGCDQFGVANNSPDETTAVHDQILDVAISTGVDKRFILAILLQESLA